MPKFSLNVNIKVVSSAKYFKYFEENLFKVMREAVAESAIVASTMVPVWSGMAKGSFLADVKVARLSGNYVTSAATIFGLVDSPGSINISALVKPFRQYYEKRKSGGTYLRTRSTIQYLKSGEIKNADAGARRSTYDVSVTEKGFLFHFESRVQHYDIGVVNASWPEDSFAVFQSELKSQMQARKADIIPKPDQYLIKITTRDLKGKQLPALRYTQVRVEKPVEDPKTKVKRLATNAKGYLTKAKNLYKRFDTKARKIEKDLGNKAKKKAVAEAYKNLKKEYEGTKLLKILSRLESFRINL